MSGQEFSRLSTDQTCCFRYLHTIAQFINAVMDRQTDRMVNADKCLSPRSYECATALERQDLNKTSLGEFVCSFKRTHEKEKLGNSAPNLADTTKEILFTCLDLLICLFLRSLTSREI